MIKGFKIKPKTIKARGDIKAIFIKKMSLQWRTFFKKAYWDNESLIVCFKTATRLLLNRKCISNNINAFLQVIKDGLSKDGLNPDDYIIEVLE